MQRNDLTPAGQCESEPNVEGVSTARELRLSAFFSRVSTRIQNIMAINEAESADLESEEGFDEQVRQLRLSRLESQYGERQLDLACDRVATDVIDNGSTHDAPGFIPDDYWPNDSLQ